MSRQRGVHSPRAGAAYPDPQLLEVKTLLPHSPAPRASPHTPPPPSRNTTAGEQRSRVSLLRQPYLTIAAFLLGTIFVTWWPALSILTGLVDSLTAPPPTNLRPRYHQPIVHGGWYANQSVRALPAWEPAVRARPWCTSTSPLYDGLFYRTKEGEVMYEPASCKLPRLTAVQARTCLANKTLLLVGDSITRYQYVSLAHFLVHGLYPQRYADDPTVPSVCLEKQFDSWPQYFSFTSALLSSPTPNQPAPPTFAAERCHCLRSNHQVSNETYENHHLTLTFSDPAPNPGPAPSPPPTSTSTLRVVFNLTLAWPTIHGAPIQAIRHAMRHYHPDAVLLNVGAWFGYGPLRNYYNLTSAAALFEPLFTPPRRPAAAKSARPPPRLIWRTMSDGRFAQRVVQLSAVMDAMATYYDWERMDVRLVTEAAARQGVAMRWDNLHFLPAMYDQWNDLLLHSLCAGR